VAEDNLNGGITSAEGQLNDLAAIEVTPTIEEAEGNLLDAKESLGNGDLQGASEGLGEVNDAIPQIVQELGTQVSAELQAEIQQELEAQTEAKDVADETNETGDETGSGDETPFDDSVVPVE
jgi:hypothetical protein